MMIAIMVGWGVVCPVRGEVAYLPCIGPVPLRFELLATAGGAVPAWKPLRMMLRSVTNAAVPAPDAENPTNATPPVVSLSPTPAATNVIRAVSLPVTGAGEKKDSGSYPVSLVSAVPPDDSSVVVSPQTLAVFFHPAPGGENTNAAMVLVPEKFGFTPPLSKAAGESQALYQTQ
jgi:hypothetical protein